MANTDVRVGSLADIAARQIDVRFAAPESGPAIAPVGIAAMRFFIVSTYTGLL